MFDSVYLDLDGPILDGKDKHYSCYVSILDDFGGKPLDIESYWNLKRNMVSREILLEKSNFNKSYDVYLSNWLERIESREFLLKDKMTSHCIDALLKIKNQCHNLTLVTMRNDIDALYWQLNHFNLSPFFDEIIACPSRQGKRKFDFLKSKISRNAIVIGDTEEDTETADKLGISCIAVTQGLRDEKYLKARFYTDYLYNIDWKFINEHSIS